MDISAIAPKTIKHRVLHPGDKTYVGFTIELHSLKSDPVKKIERQIRDKSSRLRGRGFNAKEIEANTIDVLAAAVAGWTWDNDDAGNPGNWNGTALDYLPGNVRIVLQADWLRDQLQEQLGEVSDFFST